VQILRGSGRRIGTSKEVDGGLAEGLAERGEGRAGERGDGTAR
jgi:hypothetical protein